MNDNDLFFYGRAENKLNSKGQVAIPARFRSVLPDEEQCRHYVLIRGESHCLYMYTHQQFAMVKDNARRVAEESGDAGFYRSFMAEAHPVEVDSQGRFVLPQPFIQAAGIKGQGVLFIGVDNRIEIWEPSLYEKETGGATGKYEEMRRSAARKIFGF